MPSTPAHGAADERSRAAARVGARFHVREAVDATCGESFSSWRSSKSGIELCGSYPPVELLPGLVPLPGERPGGVFGAFAPAREDPRMTFLLRALLMGCSPGAPMGTGPEPAVSAPVPVPSPPRPAVTEPAAPAEEQIVWIPTRFDDPCERAVVGTKVALFWRDDALGTSGVVDYNGVVVARDERGVGVKARGTLPPWTRAEPSYVFEGAAKITPECAARGWRYVEGGPRPP